jgi:DNA-binding beta-propeller fold protein YncE
MALALAWATLGASAADASLGELSFLGCIGQVHLSECAAVPVGLEGAVEEPKGLAVSPDGANVYAADVNASAIDVFTRNALTGALTLTSCIGQHAGCATTTQAKAVERPFAVAVSPDGESVYAVSVGSNTVDEFSRDTMNGELTYTGCIGQLAGCTSTSPAEAISGPQSIAVSPDGTSVYVASENAGGAVDEFARNGSGTLKFESCIGAGGCAVPALHEALRFANAVAISPDGTDVYVGGQGASISTFARNTFTGGLAFKGCVGNFNECVQPSPLAVNEPTSLAVSPDGANLYAGNFANGVLDVFSRNTANGSLTFAGCDGALVSQPGACTEMPSENPAGALTVAVSPDGGDVYVSAEQGVYEYARGSGGALEFAGCTGIASGVCTATVPAEALSFSVSLALSPNGASLYAGAEIGKDLNVFGRQTVGCDDVSATVPYGTPTKLTLACTDTVGNALSFAIASPPGHGTLNAVEAGGQVTYTPAAGYSGPDGFTFSAHNADGTAAPASANITVEPAPGGASTQTPGPPAPNSSSSTPGIATTPRAVEELLLGCGKRALVLNDVLVRGDRVALEGSAAKGLVGKKVKILFDGSKQVATATVESDGQFSTTAPLPPAKLRNGSSARYMAESGGQRSLDLKLTRRLDLEPPRVSGHTVTLVGQVVPPLAKPLAPVVVQQELECGNTAAVKRATPSASGRFRITLTVPIAAKAGIYRLSSTVRDNTHSKRGFATYSLPLPAVLG